LSVARRPRRSRTRPASETFGERARPTRTLYPCEFHSLFKVKSLEGAFAIARADRFRVHETRTGWSVRTPDIRFQAACRHRSLIGQLAILLLARVSPSAPERMLGGRRGPSRGVGPQPHYACAHWPSDLTGGFQVGVFWTFLSLSLGRMNRPILDVHATRRTPRSTAAHRRPRALKAPPKRSRIWSQADAATSAQWLDAGFAIVRQNFVPEGDAGHGSWPGTLPTGRTHHFPRPSRMRSSLLSAPGRRPQSGS
jgi:hypothetical protein